VYEVRVFKGEKTFNIINAIVLMAIGLIALYPLWYVLMASLSKGSDVISGRVWIWPVNFTFDAYIRAFKVDNLVSGYLNSIYITFAGTLVNILFSVTAAYSLSKSRLRGRNIITFLFVLPMWFNPGIIPIFLNIKSLGLYNTRASVILAFAITPIYLVMLRTFFQSIDCAMEESAKIDGASDMLILRKIYLALAKPAIITISLYYGVARWNGYFWTMILIRDKDKFPLQVFLKEIIVEMQRNAEFMVGMDQASYSTETLIYAFMIVAIVPMLIVYPFIQKYFEKGIMIGALKG
jgi:putative aldouronate transport system permease protein